MTIRSRIRKLEAQSVGTYPIVVFVTSFGTEPDGTPRTIYGKATIVWGVSKSAMATLRPGESEEEFKARVDAYAALTWPEALECDGLVSQQGVAA